MAEVVEMCQSQVVFSPLTGDWEGIYFSVTSVELLMSVSAGNISSILYKSTLTH